jgi:glutamyl-tRNA reductase
MSLVGLPISHKRVSIDFRERVCFDANAMANAYARFRCGDAQPTSLFEIATLSIRSDGLRPLAKVLSANDSSSSWEAIERFAESLVNKLLHDPTTQLQQAQGTLEAVDCGEAVRQLFRLETVRVRHSVEVNG